MGLKDEDLQATRTPIVGFSSKPVHPKGQNLPQSPSRRRLHAGQLPGGRCAIPIQCKNGEDLLHSMEAMPSTRH
ncbi:hypothetical protein AAC387_Pa05g1202 [Persea americana]